MTAALDRGSLVVALLVGACFLWPSRYGGQRVVASPVRAPSAGRAPRDIRRGVPLTADRGIRGRRAARAGPAVQAELADLLALLAAALRGGVAPSVAVLAAIEATGQPHPHLSGLLDKLSDRARSGEGMAESWLAHAEQTGSTDLQFIGQAWLLTERTGAPLADALATAEQALRVRVRTRERVAVVAAGPKASMAVLVALPLGGPLVGLAFGVGPADLYFSSTAATASAVLGMGLAGLGWWWGRRIMARALATRGRARQ